MKTYLEIKVPISYSAPWFSELRKALKDMPVLWQKGYYHITVAFIDDTQHLSDVEAIMHKYLDHAHPVNITFDKLDVFTAGNGMQIVYLGTNNIPEDFKTLVEDIRRDISCTHSSIQSDFKLHVTLGRITEPEADIDDVGFLIDEIDFKPFSLTLNEVEYRVFRGRSIYKTTLN
jgi:2'-5' RNA ligase